MRFDLTDLRLFIAVAEAGSISHGAEAAHLALASASSRIGGMEATLGAKLLDRGRRGVTLTPAGRALLDHARTVIAQVERMRGDLRAFASGLKGEIRMLSNSAALVELLPRALRDYLAANPDVDIDIEEMTSADIVLAVAERRADFGVMANSVDAGGLETIKLSSDRLVALLPADHELAKRDDLHFADLLGEPFIGLRGGGLHDHLAGHAARLGQRISYRVRLRSFETVAPLVEAGIGIAVLPLTAAERYQTGHATIVPLADRWAERRLLLCARQFDRLSAHARRFVDAIVQAAGGTSLPVMRMPAPST